VSEGRVDDAAGPNWNRRCWSVVTSGSRPPTRATPCNDQRRRCCHHPTVVREVL